VRYKAKLLVPALAGILGLLVLPSAGAHAATTNSPTQLTGFHQMVLDEADGYLFISEGTGHLFLGPVNTTGIVVTDLSGNYVTTLDAGDGVEGLVLSADGGTLYAALASDSAVAAISVSSITPTTTTPVQALYSLGAGQVPYGLALQSGELWVSYNPQGGGAGQAAIGSFDLSQASPSFQVAPGTSGWYYPPDLYADPSDTGILVAAGYGLSSNPVATYSVAGSTLTTLAPPQLLDNCASGAGLAVLPGGSELFAACGQDNYYSTTNLLPLDGYTTGVSGATVAIAPDGGVMAVGQPYSYAPQISLYDLRGSTRVNEYTFKSPGGVFGAPILLTRGLALSPDGSELYAVTEDLSSAVNGPRSFYALHVYSNPAAAVTLTGPSTDIAGNSLTMTGTVMLPAGTPPPAGATVTVTATAAGSSTPVTLPTVSTAADGTFTLSDTPTAPGTYTYTASYGDSSAASFVVNVTPDLTALTLSGPDTVKKDHKFTLSGTLTFDGNPAPAGTALSITVSWPGPSQATTLPSVTTAADGTFTVYGQKFKDVGTYTYTAQYAGSPTDGPATAQWTVTVFQQ
jgi:hypothetical protein